MQFFWAHFSLISRLKSTFFAWWKKKPKNEIFHVEFWLLFPLAIEQNCMRPSIRADMNLNSVTAGAQTTVGYTVVNKATCFLFTFTMFYVFFYILRNYIKWKASAVPSNEITTFDEKMHIHHTQTQTHTFAYNCRANVPNQENVHVSCINRNVE